MNRGLEARIARLEAAQPQSLEAAIRALTDAQLDEALRWVTANLGGPDTAREHVPAYLLPIFDQMAAEDAARH